MSATLNVQTSLEPPSDKASNKCWLNRLIDKVFSCLWVYKHEDTKPVRCNRSVSANISELNNVNDRSLYDQPYINQLPNSVNNKLVTPQESALIQQQQHHQQHVLNDEQFNRSFSYDSGGIFSCSDSGVTSRNKNLTARSKPEDCSVVTESSSQNKRRSSCQCFFQAKLGTRTRLDSRLQVRADNCSVISAKTGHRRSGETKLGYICRPHKQSKKSFKRRAFTKYNKMIKEGTLSDDPEGRPGCHPSRVPGHSNGQHSGGASYYKQLSVTENAPSGWLKSSVTPSLNSSTGFTRAPREEISLVRDAIGALRTNFRSTDPNQHILDTLEQAIAVLMEKNVSSAGSYKMEPQSVGAENKRLSISGSSEDYTKVIYFTERTVTPFMSTIAKALGDVTLRDFKIMFDRTGPFRYHFKNYDPEYGMVKEEITHDDHILPGVEGKITAWVQEDHD